MASVIIPSTGVVTGTAPTLGSNWVLPRLANVLTPDANGATLDSQGLLTGAITEISAGRFNLTVNGGVAKTNPDDGAVMVFDMLDANGTALTNFFRNLTANLTVHTAAPGSSGLVLAYGVAIDGALVESSWAAFDWDLGVPRARSGEEGLFGASTGHATGVAGQYAVTVEASATATDVAYLQTVRAHIRDATGAVLGTSARANNKNITTTTPKFFIAVFGSKVLAGPYTIEFSVEYAADPIPGSELL